MPTLPAEQGDPGQGDGYGVLAPLNITDPQAFIAGLSDAERVCLPEDIDPDRLMSLMMSQAPVMDEGVVSLVGCLEHETVLRLFLTSILTMTGPLVVESSNCIRNSFTDVDLATMMMAQTVGSVPDEELETMDVVAMLSIFLALSCLSEDEFRVVGSLFEMSPEDREGLQCLLDELGGPERIASLMLPGAGIAMELFFIELFGASLKCEIQIAGPG